jgi:manganese-dependent inorganic pyrophosphatase
MQIIVIGHKNPDMDSICSAVGYARLKQLLGVPDVIAARAGNTNARIDFVLNKFGVETPVFLSDVSPRISDVMQRDAVTVRADSSVYDAIQLIAEEELRGLVVTDEEGQCLGLLSAFKLNNHLFPPREDAEKARMIVASLTSIVKTFVGTVVAGKITAKPSEQILMVGAMDRKTFGERLERQKNKHIVVIVGNRDDIQMQAVEARVNAIIVTGGLAVAEQVLTSANEARVAIISSPHDTATTVLLARGAVRVDRMIEPYMSFHPDTPLEIARERAATSASFIFPVIDENGKLEGVLSKSDFIRPVQRKLVLVDHNELSQAVTGADRIPIVEILDHHRIGGFTNDMPIHFWNNPVGSTSTIVALCYHQMGIPVPPDVAGLLMAGLISDTLNLTSPTTTPVDVRVLDDLSKIAKTDPTELAKQIFSVGSPLLTMTHDQVITADCKEYDEKGKRFTVSQIEELNFSHLAGKQAGILEALERHCHNRALFFAALLITDINTQNSLLIVHGAPEFLNRINFPTRSPHVWELEGIVSRKKQLLPYLLQCLSSI